MSVSYLLGHLPRKLSSKITQITTKELSCADCQVLDDTPAAALGQKGLQIPIFVIKVVLHKRKCAIVSRRLRRKYLI